jgi:hypothetical protein
VCYGHRQECADSAGEMAPIAGVSVSDIHFEMKR